MSGNVQGWGANFANVRRGGFCDVLAGASLRGVSEVPNPVPGRVQSVSEWLVPGTDGAGLVRRVDVVLFVWVAAYLKPVEREGVAGVRGVAGGAWARVRSAGGDCRDPAQGGSGERRTVLNDR